MCTRPVECFLIVEDGKERLLFREPIGAQPDSYVLFMKDCGRCPSCLEKRARELAIRCQHEAQMHKANAFLTLTYDDEHLPHHGSLRRRDVVLFLKRLRKLLAPARVRFLLVGEYGSQTLRAHYHVLLFGEDFLADRVPVGKSKSGFRQWESAALAKAWGLGRCTVAELTLETCFYVCRYALKSSLGGVKRGEREVWWQHPLSGQWLLREREFQLMSTHPGLGREWFEKYSRDVTSGDAVVVRGGQKFKPPRYYDKVLRSWSEEDYQAMKARRLEQALEGARLAEGAPKRLAAREVVQVAKHNLSKRGL